MIKEKTICESVHGILMMSLDPDYFDLDSSEKTLAESHLKKCKECREFYAFLIEQRVMAAVAAKSCKGGSGPKQIKTSDPALRKFCGGAGGRSQDVHRRRVSQR